MTTLLYDRLRYVTMAVLTVFIIGMTTACASTQTRAVQALFALDGSFAVAQDSALAIMQSGILTAEQKSALQTLDHHIAERLKRLTDTAISIQQGGSVTGTLTQEDVDGARQELSLFKGVLSLLKPPQAQTASTTSKE